MVEEFTKRIYRRLEHCSKENMFNTILLNGIVTFIFAPSLCVIYIRIRLKGSLFWVFLCVGLFPPPQTAMVN